jgi:hypothetical protein
VRTHKGVYSFSVFDKRLSYYNEIHVRSGVYYAAFSEMDKKNKVMKEIEIPLFSIKSKSLSFPYKFTVNGKPKEFSEAEFQEIEAMLRNPKRRKKPSSP